MAIVAPVPTSVYKYYDNRGLLLYVGITSRSTARQREHNADKMWWPFVTRQEVEHHPHRMAAEQREKALIRKYRPPFNTQHNPDHRVTRAVYLAAAGAGDVTTDVRAARRLLAELHHRLPLVQVSSGSEAEFTCSPDHEALMRHVRYGAGLLILAPKKVGQLVDVRLDEDRPALTFEATADPIPVLRDPFLRIKHRGPIMVAHEVQLGGF